MSTETGKLLSLLSANELFIPNAPFMVNTSTHLLPLLLGTITNRKLDLIVGAPFFYSKSEGGAVYVYLNSPESLLNNTYALRLTGPPESRFGFSLTSLGDINQVGVHDYF